MDVATLGVKLVLEGEQQTVRGLNNVAAAGVKAEASTKTLTASQKALAQQGVTLDQVLAAVNGETKVTAQVQQAAAQATIRTSQAFNNVATSSRSAGAGINGLREPLTSAACSLLGLNPIAAQTASVLGAFALGAAPMVGVLAGVAALGFAYNKLTEDARKAKDENKKLLEVLDDLVNREKFSLQRSYDANVKLLGSLVGEREGVVERRSMLRKARGVEDLGFFAESGFASKLSDIDKQIAVVKARVEAGTREVESVYRESTARQAEERKQALAKEVADYERQGRELVEAVRGRAETISKLIGDEQREYERVYNETLRVLEQTLDAEEKLRTDHYNSMVSEARRAYDEEYNLTLDFLEKEFRAREEAAERQRQFLREQSQFIPDRLGAASNVAGFLGVGGGVQSVLAGAASGASLGAWGAAAGALLGAGRVLLDAAKAQQEAARAVRDARNREGDFITLGVSSVRDERHAINVLAQELFTTIRQQFRDGIISAQDFNTRFRAVQEAYQRKWEDVASRFWSDIGEQFNALNGPAGEYLNAQNAIQRSYIENRKNAEALGASQDELNRIEALRVGQLNALVNQLEQAATSLLLGRLGMSTPTQRFLGDSPNAGWFDLFEKYVNSVEATRKAAEDSAYWDQISAQIQEQSLQKLTASLSAQEDTVAGLRQTYEALKRYSDSLNLSTLSPLTPIQRYNEAKNQYNAIRTLAAGGDKSALASLPDTANTFLQESQNVFRSSARYQADFTGVRTFVSDITAQYGAQLTTQEKILKELEAQTAIANASLRTEQSSLVQQLVDSATANGSSGNVSRIIQTLNTLGYQLGMDAPNGYPTGKYYALPGYTQPTSGPASGWGGNLDPSTGAPWGYTWDGLNGTWNPPSSSNTALLQEVQGLRVDVQLMGQAIQAAM